MLKRLQTSVKSTLLFRIISWIYRLSLIPLIHPQPSVTDIAARNRSTRQVTLIVYDAFGKTVRILVAGQQPPGDYRVRFNASGLPSGVYFACLHVDAFNQIQKMVLLR